MKKTLLIASALFALNLSAQQDSSEKMNIVKTNVTVYICKNINLSYERSFNRWFSMNLGFGTVPEGKVPFLNSFLDDTDRQKINNLQVQASNFTVEPRFYIGQG